MSKVIQITDTHIVPHGQLAYGVVDTAEALADTVATINRVLPQIGPVDLVMVTGDLTDFGSAEEYQRFGEIMSALALSYRVVPGNHDKREALRAVFAGQDWMPASGPVDWLLELDEFVLVALDTLVQGEPFGDLHQSSLAFLSDASSRHQSKPLLVGLHHPPFSTGIRAMDRNNLRDATSLRDILDAHPTGAQLVCGHVHRNIVTRFGNSLCQIAPGTSHAVTLEHREGANNSLTIEPGGFLLHEWRDALVSHHIPVGRYEGPHSFAPKG